MSILENKNISTLSSELQLQNLYNYIAKEEREIIFYSKLVQNELTYEHSTIKVKKRTQKDLSLLRTKSSILAKKKNTTIENNKEELVLLITFGKGKFYIELMNIRGQEADFLLSYCVEDIKKIEKLTEEKFNDNYLNDNSNAAVNEAYEKILGDMRKNNSSNNDNDYDENNVINDKLDNKSNIVNDYMKTKNLLNANNESLFERDMLALGFNDNTQVLLEFPYVKENLKQPSPTLENKKKINKNEKSYILITDKAANNNYAVNLNNLSSNKLEPEVDSSKKHIHSPLIKFFWSVFKIIQYINNPSMLSSSDQSTMLIIKKYFPQLKTSQIKQQNENINLYDYSTSTNKLEYISIENLSLKDIHEIAFANDYYKIHDIYFPEKDNIQKSTLNNKETSILIQVFKELSINNITDFDIDTLNTKIESFNIETKESFIREIHNNFDKEAASYSNKISKVENFFSQIETNTRDDLSSINDLFSQIQKIEETNHQEEIKCSNMQKLLSLMKDILTDLSPGNEATLIKSEYKSKSELVIAKAALTRFTEFFLNRKRSNIKLDLIEECQARIIKIMIKIINNFSKVSRKLIVDEYKFKETNLLRNCVDLKSLKSVCSSSDASLFYTLSGNNNSNITTNTEKTSSLGFDVNKFMRKLNSLLNLLKYRKTSIFRFFRERKFFIEGFGIIFSEISNNSSFSSNNNNNNNNNYRNILSLESNYLSLINTTITENNEHILFCEEQLSKALRDSIFNEINTNICIWEAFWELNLFNSEKLDIYLYKNDLLNFDIFESSNEKLFSMGIEFSAFLCSLIINVFFSIDSSAEALNMFFEGTKSSKSKVVCVSFSNLLKKSIDNLTQPIFKALNQYFDMSLKKNILIVVVIYCVLLAIKTKIQKNVLSDYVIMKLSDVLVFNNNVLEEVEESILFSDGPNTNNNAYSQVKSNFGNTFNLTSRSNNTENNNNNNFNIQDYTASVGLNKISLFETKKFIEQTTEQYYKIIQEFIKEQYACFDNYKLDIRYIGIIPIIKKTINLIKIFICLTSTLKQDFLIEVIENFIKRSRQLLETAAKTKEKYTNIVYIENYYFIYKFFSYIEEKNIILNSHSTLENLQREVVEVFNYRKDMYVKENLSHFFNDYLKFFTELKTQYNNLKENNNLQLLKVQNNFTYEKVDKQSMSFLKNLKQGMLVEIAERVYKHFGKENLVTRVIWVHTKCFFRDVIGVLKDVYDAGYGRSLDKSLTDDILNKLDGIDIDVDFKKK